MKNLKQPLNHGLVLTKVHKVKAIKFIQYALLKLYISMNTDLGAIAFLSGWIMQFLKKLWKMWENIEILNLSQQKKDEII